MVKMPLIRTADTTAATKLGSHAYIDIGRRRP